MSRRKVRARDGREVEPWEEALSRRACVRHLSAEELQQNADAEARRLEKQRQKRAELSKELAGSRLYTEPRQMQLVAHELRR